MTFSFKQADEDGGKEVTSYRVKQAVSGEDFVIIYEKIGVNVLEFIAENLTPEVNYEFTVEAKNVNGFSLPSLVEKVYFDPLLPPNPPENLKDITDRKIGTAI